MKIKRLLMALLLLSVAFLLAACDGSTVVTPGVQETPVHEHTVCPDCGLCLDVNCTGDKCAGHDAPSTPAPAHQHNACPVCGLCLDANCTGEKCLGHDAPSIPAHEHNACPECGLCLDPECDGEKCEGHVPAHEHNACPECGLCLDPECDGEKCEGHVPAHEHNACPECGLCLDPECDGEKCEGHVPAHEHNACPECGLCLDPECDGEKCEGHEPVHEHTAAEEWLSDEENHWHACSGCEEAVELDKAAHAHGAGVVTVPTADVLGNILYSCECGHSYVEYIPTLGNVYLNAGGAAMWDKDNARFAVYTWDGGDQWFDMVKIEGTDIYTVKLPAGISNIIFVRMNGSTTANNWNNKWDQTNDLKLPLDGTNLYTISSWGQDTNWKGVGSWSTQTIEHEHDLKWANDENNHWHLCKACGYIADEAEHAYVDAFGNGYKWTECECGLKTEEVVALTYSGTFSGYVEANAEGVYVLPKMAFATWNRISFSYDGVLLSLDNASFEGLFIPEVAAAPWDERLYTEDKSLWLCSKGAGAEYIFSFDPNTMTVTSILGGLKWGGTWNEIAEKNSDGVYVVTKTFAQWNRITVTYDGKLLKLEDLTVTGAFSPEGATSEPKLYHEDGLFLYAGAAKVTFVVSFDPETMTLNIEEQKLPANQMAVVVGQDVGDNRVALWQAGTVIKGADGKWLGNGWRLYVVVDAEGKIAYMVKMPPNGYGNPAGTAWYSHSSLREENSAWEITDDGYTITVPEGGFALTTHGNAINSLLELLGATGTSDAEINKAGALEDSIRISYDATAGTITVTHVE